MTNPINNTVFDTRDLIEYKESLESDLLDMFNDYISEIEEEHRTDFNEIDLNLEGFRNRFETEIEDYEEIEKFCEDLSNASDFQHGEGVISELYFTDYCKETLVDCGYIPKDMPSWIEIDFEATAENMSADYTTAEYNGETYYIRS